MSIKDIEKKPEALPVSLKAIKGKIVTELVRKGGVTYFQFAVAPEVEKLFNENSREKKVSNTWKGLEFYYNPEIMKDESYMKLLSNYGLRDEFGHELCSSRDGRMIFNIAWLRTVGGVGKIEVSENLPYSEFNLKIKDALSCIKTYFDTYLREFKIKGTVEVEM